MKHSLFSSKMFITNPRRKNRKTVDAALLAGASALEITSVTSPSTFEFRFGFRFYTFSPLKFFFAVAATSIGVSVYSFFSFHEQNYKYLGYVPSLRRCTESQFWYFFQFYPFIALPTLLPDKIKILIPNVVYFYSPILTVMVLSFLSYFNLNRHTRHIYLFTAIASVVLPRATLPDYISLEGKHPKSIIALYRTT